MIPVANDFDLAVVPLSNHFTYCIIMLGSICNSYTMDCPPVRGDNPRALASGLSYV